VPGAAQTSLSIENSGDLPTFKANVNLVNLYFNVKDKHGLLVSQLNSRDFKVLEDGKPQTVKNFAMETDQPLIVGMLLDTSQSQRMVLGMEQEVGAQFLRQVLRAKDRAFLVSIDTDVKLMQDFTASPNQLAYSLSRARIGAGIGTLLYDAVWLISRVKLASEPGRKAMILLTDGQDVGSRKRIREAIDEAQKADALVYVIMIADEESLGMYDAVGGYKGDKAMDDLARETGGRVIKAGHSEKKLQEAFDQISAELRSQYSLGYSPTNAKLDGTFRKIEIRTQNKEYRIQARSGYYAAKNGAAKQVF